MSLLSFAYWDETANVLPADRARLLSLDEALAALGTNAEVAAWHDECVFLLAQANQTFFLLVLVVLRANLTVLYLSTAAV